jgi:large subunit ribosomal protein L3
MKFILATKAYMTQIYDAEGRVHPATVLSVDEHAVTQVKNKETDGYSAVQVATGTTTQKHVNDAQKAKGLFRHFREHRVSDDSALAALEKNAGETYTIADAFAEGDTVIVSATSKAKGFQGVVKRHNFSGGPRTHGQKHNERQPGSIGGGLRCRVPKGMRMAGRMGGVRVTVKNLTVVKVDAEQGKLYLRGAVPGRRGTLVEVRSA